EVQLAGEPDRLLDGPLGLPGQTENEGAVNHQPGALRAPGELDVLLHPDALLHVVEDLLRGRFVAHHEIAGAPVLHDPQGLVVEVPAGVAAPCDPERLEAARDLPRALLLEAERVVVEKELIHGGKVDLRPGHLGDDVVDGALAIAVATRRLWPETEG